MNDNPTDLRQQLLDGGYFPLPLRGKAPDVLKGWQKKFDTNPDEIAMWAKTWPDARNTGILTKFTPTLDIDVTHPEAARAVADLAAERFEERGYILQRTGKAPKVAIPFRTDAPFPKIIANLVAPDGGGHKIEFLCDGQQVVVDGTHPDTGKPYSWHGGDPGRIAHQDLPHLTQADARQLVDDAVKVLVGQFGFRLSEQFSKPRANGADHGGSTDWAPLLGNVIDHDALVILAAKLVAAGMAEGAAVNLLRALVDAAPGDAANPLRKMRRLAEIPDIVSSGAKKIGAAQEQQPEITSPNEGSAFGYSWSWRLYGEVAVADSRPQLVEGLLPATGVGLIAGQWGTYKTFVGNDLAAAVMTSGTFIKFPVRRKGAVLFFAVEGQSEVAIRITAAYEARGGTGRAPFAWVENCPRLLDPNADKILAAMVKQANELMLKEFGLPVALIIIDTAGKAAGYTKTGDENDAANAKQIMKTMASASIETNALYLGVAHFGKAVETGTRGSSSFEDDSDVVLALLGQKGQNGAVENARLCARKRRSGQNGEEFAFRTKSVDMGVDTHGAPLTTLTIEWLPEDASAPSGKPKADQWSKAIRLLRQCLMTIIADCGSNQRPFPDGPVVRAVDLEQVREEFYKAHPATGDAKAKTEARRKAFGRAIKEAGSRGLIATRDIGATTFVWLVAPETPANVHTGDDDE
jgi:hypothetical protein